MEPGVIDLSCGNITKPLTTKDILGLLVGTDPIECILVGLVILVSP